MSLFDQVDLLQREWTDQFVQVDDSVAELKRFAGLTGQVKTVNMSGQALVEFDGSEDIGWYDIHPQFLTVVTVQTNTEQPVDTPADETPATAQAAAATATQPAAAPADTSKLSPLELARMQDASGNTATPAAPSKPPAKETPDQTTPAETQDTAAAAPAPTQDTSNLSPLELARMQDASGNTATPAAPSKPPAKETPDQTTPAETQDTAAAAPAPTQDTSNLSPLELARMQDTGGNTAAAAPDAPAAEQNVAEETAVETEEVVEEAVAEGETDSAAANVEIPDAEGPNRTAAILAACRAQDGG
jgi:hypothetical protein